MRAQERLQAGREKGRAVQHGKEVVEGNLPPTKTRDVVARAVGLSGSTYERAQPSPSAA